MFTKCYYGEGEFGDEACVIQGEDINGTNYICRKTETKELRRQGELHLNRLTPNDPYMGRTAPLTSKRCILYIYQQI